MGLISYHNIRGHPGERYSVGSGRSGSTVSTPYKRLPLGGRGGTSGWPREHERGGGYHRLPSHLPSSERRLPSSSRRGAPAAAGEENLCEWIMAAESRHPRIQYCRRRPDPGRPWRHHNLSGHQDRRRSQSQPTEVLRRPRVEACREWQVAGLPHDRGECAGNWRCFRRSVSVCSSPQHQVDLQGPVFYPPPGGARGRYGVFEECR